MYFENDMMIAQQIKSNGFFASVLWRESFLFIIYVRE